MLRKTMRFLSVMLTALILGAGLAHVFSLPNTIRLSREDYMTVQQIYAGWSSLRFVLAGAVVCTLMAAVMLHRRPKALILTLVALVCMGGSLIVFFQYTYPVDQQTRNWTTLPSNWQELRDQWEYSYAANAGLYFCAMASLTLSMLVRDKFH